MQGKSFLSIGVGILVLLIVGAGIFYFLKPGLGLGIQGGQENGEMMGASDPKNATYVIDGQKVTLHDGVSSVPAAPGSASMVETKYFGNDLQIDLNGDGRVDDAFIVTQNTGGSGTFFYAVAALNTEKGYIGSDGYLLGDRIAPQSTTKSPNTNQPQVVVFNFADRNAGEPMTAQPSVGKSVYLKLDTQTMQWGIVQPDFEGESSGVNGVNMSALTAKMANSLYQNERFYLIDNSLILAVRTGNAADASYSHVLMDKNLNQLCIVSDSIAGPRESCADSSKMAIFDTMKANLDKANLGLSGHTVVVLR